MAKLLASALCALALTYCLAMEAKPVAPAAIEVCPTCKVLFLIRHGESTWNAAKGIFEKAKELTKVDSPLNSNGITDGMALFRALWSGKGEAFPGMSDMLVAFVKSAAVAAPPTKEDQLSTKFRFAKELPDEVSKLPDKREATAKELLTTNKKISSNFVSNLRRAIDTYFLAFMEKDDDPPAMTSDIQEVSIGRDAASKISDDGGDKHMRLEVLKPLLDMQEGGRHDLAFKAYVKGVYKELWKTKYKESVAAETAKSMEEWLAKKYENIGIGERPGNADWGSARCPLREDGQSRWLDTVKVRTR
jgi:broad specificity phosphatase PhoE